MSILSAQCSASNNIIQFDVLFPRLRDTRLAKIALMLH
jgi:hypothetical protein